MDSTKQKWYNRCISWLIQSENIRYSIRLVFLMFAIAYFSIELTDKWQPSFNKYIVDAYLNISSGWGISLMILCSIMTVIGIVYLIAHKTRIRWRRVCPLLFVGTFLYIHFRFYSNSYDFLPLNWCFKYLDWGIILIALLVIDFIIIEILSHKLIESQNSLYIYDSAINDSKDDILNYSSKAKSAAQDILKFDISEHSWSIGVTGEWGSGKTSYINLILKNLPTHDFEIIKFSPRSSKDVTTIQEDALNLLSEKLGVYHLGLSSLFRDYIYALQLIDSNGWVNKIFSPLHNIQNKKDILVEALKHLPKKVVFVIDDFDRLTQNEIMEILKLLDNNANFPNVIYITAYDKQYVKQQFEDYDHNQSDSCFVDKFFNVEWNIPLRDYYGIYNYIISQLRAIVDTTQFGYDISEINTKGFYCNIFQKYIPTMRDAKRLINLFQSDYQMVNGEVDVIDFLLLTIIKYRYRDEYTALFRLEYVEDGSNQTFQYNKKEVTNIASKELIELLFRASGGSNRPRRIYQKESFYNYFIDHINNKIRLPQLSALFSMTASQIDAIIKGWSSDKEAMSELFDYINTRSNHITSTEELFRYIDIVLLYNGYSNSSSAETLAKQITITTGILSDYNNKFLITEFNQDILHAYLVKYFTKERLLLGDISLLRDMCLATEEQQNELLLLTASEVKEIIINHFNKYAAETDIFDKYGIDLLYACIDYVKPSDRHIILDNSCCKQARQLIEKYPDYYFNTFVRLLYSYSSHADSNAITCEPFWEQIFESSTELNQLIFSERLNNIKYIKRVRNFWRIYSENNYKPIEFINQGVVLDIINNDLIVQISQLEKLKTYESLLQKIILNPENNMNFKISIQYKEKIKEMKQNIEQIKLNIKLKHKLLRDIEHITGYIK